MSPRRGESWSIAERTTRWFAINTAVVAQVIAVVAAYFVRASVHRELATLVHEELDEVAIACRWDAAGGFDAGRRAEFDELVQVLQGQHGSNAMGWRLWDAVSGDVLADFGAKALLSPDTPSPTVLETTRASDHKLWTCSTRLQDGYIVGLVIDGSAQIDRLNNFVWLSLALALVTGLITFLGGKLLINRAVDYMRQIAERMRELRTAQNPEPLVNAPDEIKAIHEALSALMASIHTEQERTRLLTAGLAHELGSPLQNLIGETEVALMSDKSPEEYRTVLESHLDELRDIGHAIGNLMTLVSIDESATPHDLERFDLAGEAEVRLRRERAHALRRGIELDVAKDGDLGLVGDREALWLVVSNLVANAIDYTPRGGRVRLSMEGSPASVVVVVDDSGPGIAEDQREKIFEPFYRGPTTRGRRAGYGLGLSIAKAAVRSQGGTIAVERSPLGGARFRVELPRARVLSEPLAV